MGVDRLDIQYIRAQPLALEVPANRGEYYDAMVPDTLDLAERAELGINGLTAPTDPAADHELFWYANFFREPPVLVHAPEEMDTFQWAKFMEALPLLRLICGSRLNESVERAWFDVLARMIGPDGLAYVPLRGRPWARGVPLSSYVFFIDPVWRADGSRTTLSDESVSQYAMPTICGRLIGAMTVSYLRDGNPRWRGIIERMIQRLAELAVDKGDYAYFPEGSFEPGAKVPPDAPMPRGLFSASVSCGRALQGLAQYCRVTGYEPARALCAKLARQVIDHSDYFADDGGFLTDKVHSGDYFHGHTIGLLGVIEHAAAAGDREMIEFVKRGFGWGRAHGQPLVGFMRGDFYPTSEICEIADMIAIALKLTETGAGDYWDDVDRWVRNQFAEGQLTRTDWIERIPRPQGGNPVLANESSDRVAERSVGAFSGWARANEWTGSQGIMHCCTGNGARALYYVWEHILDCREGRLRINLLLNRASPWADLDSFIPYEGRVDVKVKTPVDLLIRIPEWVQPAEASLRIARKGSAPSEAAARWEGRYVRAGAVGPGDTVTLAFPIAERTLRNVLIGDALYTLIVKGTTVVSIDPPGTCCPLYKRDHYRDDRVRWRQVRRFVSDARLEW